MGFYFSLNGNQFHGGLYFYGLFRPYVCILLWGIFILHGVHHNDVSPFKHGGGLLRSLTFRISKNVL